jgi:hypothetical protein
MNHTDIEDIPIEYYFLIIPVGFALICITIIRCKTQEYMYNH